MITTVQYHFGEIIIYVSSINKIFLDKRFIKKSKIFDHIINVMHQLIKDINKNNHLIGQAKIKNKKYSVSFDDDEITLFYGEDDQYTTEDYNKERSEILNFFRNLKLDEL